MLKSLAQIKRRSPEELQTLLSASNHESITSGQKLCAEARDYGVSMRDFLSIAIDPKLSENKAQFSDGNKLVGGYEAALQVLNLPVRDSFSDGIFLNLASDTFQTFPGPRAVFPEVIDDILRWNYRQDQFETTAAFVANSRTIHGIELLSTIVDDDSGDYKAGGRTVARQGEDHPHDATVRDFLQARLGYPYLVRVPASGPSRHADPVREPRDPRDGDLEGRSGHPELAWLVARAKAGTPVDTVVGNWDAYIQWLMMFAIPNTANTRGDADNLAAAGFRIGGVPLINGVVNFALSSTMTASQLLGMSKGDSLEELVEAGSTINESERAILNQSITYVKTLNAGYKLAFGDTRSIFNYGA